MGVTEIVGVLLGVWLAEGDEEGDLEGVCERDFDMVRLDEGLPEEGVTVCGRRIAHNIGLNRHCLAWNSS